MILRVICFCFDKIDSNDKNDSKYSLFNMIHYSHYPTFLFVAPFVPYNNFVLCVSIYIDYNIKYKKKINKYLF